MTHEDFRAVARVLALIENKLNRKLATRAFSHYAQSSGAFTFCPVKFRKAVAEYHASE